MTHSFAHLILRPVRLALAMLASLLALAGCDQMPVESAATPSVTVSERSAESLKLEAYYANLQTKLRSQGLLRTDGGGPDVPFTESDLVENFERVALYDEYTVRGGRFVAQQTPSHLRRWEHAIRLGIVFGPKVPEAQRAKNRANVAAYARRLSRLTGVSITLSDVNPNFHILFLYHDEQLAVGPTLRRLIPELSNLVIDEVVRTPRSTFCVAYAFSENANENSYSSALILVKAEHTDLMRLSCIHEEMAQAMGLANDSPTARPSIFNDDEEFALLTRQDELMLKMLYDRRLQLGMTPQMARPLLPTIANDVMHGSS